MCFSRVLVSMILSLSLLLPAFASSDLDGLLEIKTFSEIANSLGKHRKEDADYFKKLMSQQQINLQSKLPVFSVVGHRIHFKNGVVVLLRDGEYDFTFKGKKYSFTKDQSLREVIEELSSSEDKKTTYFSLDLIFPKAHAVLVADDLIIIGVVTALGLIGASLKYAKNTSVIDDETKLGNVICSPQQNSWVDMEKVKEQYNKLSDLNKEFCIANNDKIYRGPKCEELQKAKGCLSFYINLAKATDNSDRGYLRKDLILDQKKDAYFIRKKASQQ